MSKLNKTKKNKIRMYDNYYSDELISIFTADSILSDVYLGKCHTSHAYKTTKRRNIDRSSDNYLVYCTSCKLVWENHYKYKPRVYHDNVPAYGKKRLTCEKCERKEIDEQDN